MKKVYKRFDKPVNPLYENTLHDHRMKLDIIRRQPSYAAQFLGITQAAFYKWERGESVPSLVNLTRACQYYNADADELWPKLFEIREEERELPYRIGAASDPHAEIRRDE